jgi:phospholipid/cholesterol/gamma-HCH transport system permease protein
LASRFFFPSINVLGSPALLVFSRQVYFSGVQSLLVVLLSASLVGAGFVLAFHGVLSAGFSTGALEFLGLIVVRSLAVLIPAFIFCARSITAITSEISLMSVTGEIRSLLQLGISPFYYLILPRALAAALSMLFLYFYFLFAALAAGLFVAGDSIDFSQIVLVFDSVRPLEVVSGAVRSFLLGACLVFWVCRFEARGHVAIPDVSKAASSAVLHALLLVLLLELFYQFLVNPLLLP